MLHSILTTIGQLRKSYSDDVAAAAYRYRQGGVGFSDLMILKAVERANAAPLHTFDHRLARLRGATLVGAPEGRTDD